jgi:hypothetical protein
VLGHRAEVGRTYRLVLSTTAGLYRYDLDDRVRVEGRWRRSPVLRFLGRGRDVVSVTGEKLTAAQLTAAAARVLPAEVVGFVVTVELAERPALVVAVEGPLAEGAELALDRALRSLNEEYDSKRASDRYRPPVVVDLPSGAFARWRARRLAEGAQEGQVKEPVVVDAATLAWLRDPHPA